MDLQENKNSRNYNNNNNNKEILSEDEMDLRRGPWTVEEDFTLINYIAHHGEGRWNSLARCAGLKRTGKSCRLRWLNYLRPDVRRGNITLEEQLLILELHSRWGNRWSKIAQHLPGRTDNEIKNYWRTRVQKHAKQLKCDVNSKQFKDTMRYLWMPRLVERIQASAASGPAPAPAPVPVPSSSTTTGSYQLNNIQNTCTNLEMGPTQIISPQLNMNGGVVPSYTAENSSAAGSSDQSFGTPVSDLTECQNNYPQLNYYPVNNNNNDNNQVYGDQSLISPTGYYYNQGLDFVEQNSQWMDGGDVSDGLWNVDDVWFLQQQFNNNV